MPELKDIPGIGKASLELLEAAGISDAEQLAEQDVDKLMSELEKANNTVGAVKRPPSKFNVLKWIAGAMELTEDQEDFDTVEGVIPPMPPVNYEQNPEVAEMLDDSPAAIPLPGKVMMERKLRVSDVPAGLLLNRYSGDLDVRISRQEEGAPDPRLEPKSAPVSRALPAGRSFEGARLQASSTATGIQVTNNDEEDRVSLIRSPREATNRGKNPNSRRFIRGVLHTHPWSMRIGAVFALPPCCKSATGRYIRILAPPFPGNA